VLEEVSQATLVVIFLHRTHLLGDVEIDLSFRFFIVADVVGQSVRELADAHLLIYGERRESILSHHRGDY